MSTTVRLTALAESQISAIHAWWQVQRDAAPFLFSEELSEALWSSVRGRGPDLRKID